jgi:hypothetical protein
MNRRRVRALGLVPLVAASVLAFLSAWLAAVLRSPLDGQRPRTQKQKGLDTRQSGLYDTDRLVLLGGNGLGEAVCPMTGYPR